MSIRFFLRPPPPPITALFQLSSWLNTDRVGLQLRRHDGTQGFGIIGESSKAMLCQLCALCFFIFSHRSLMLSTHSISRLLHLSPSHIHSFLAHSFSPTLDLASFFFFHFFFSPSSLSLSLSFSFSFSFSFFLSFSHTASLSGSTNSTMTPSGNVRGANPVAFTVSSYGTRGRRRHRVPLADMS